MPPGKINTKKGWDYSPVKIYRRRITTSTIAAVAAQSAVAGFPGDSSAGGGSVPSGVGIFRVDFRIIVVTVFAGLPEEAVVNVVA